MNNTKSGYQNVAVGRSSLLYNNEGFDNVAVGDRALRDNNASYNTGLGRHALQQNINGNFTSVGYFSGGQLNTSGVSPTIGGNNNTFIGAFADTVSGVLIENSTAIGAGAIVTSSNTIQLGDEYIERLLIHQALYLQQHSMVMGQDSQMWVAPLILTQTET